MTIAPLRERLARDPADRDARLQLGLALLRAGESRAARAALDVLVIEEGVRPDAIANAAQAALAQLDEIEGDRDRAATRWEWLLGDDIDHPEARAQLARLRPLGGFRRPVATTSGGLRATTTILSPEGLTTARYSITGEIGRGASSTVYLARDVVLDIPIALKVLHPAIGAASRARARERFYGEARAAARLRHPGIVAIYDVDERAHSLAMEYLPGGTLRTRLGSASEPAVTPVSADEVRTTAARLLDALAHLHAAGLIHGDVKPRNILLRGPGVPVLADFGVARLLGDELVAREAPAGTPSYLSPEQLRGGASSVAGDLFAVGAIAWEMTVGRPMRRHDDLVVGRFDPAPLPADVQQRLQATAPDLVDLIATLTANEAAHRPARATDAIARLAATHFE